MIFDSKVKGMFIPLKEVQLSKITYDLHYF